MGLLLSKLRAPVAPEPVLDVWYEPMPDNVSILLHIGEAVHMIDYMNIDSLRQGINAIREISGHSRGTEECLNILNVQINFLSQRNL